MRSSKQQTNVERFKAAIEASLRGEPVLQAKPPPGVIAGPLTKPDGPLVKAWREWMVKEQEEQRRQQSLTLRPENVQTAVQASVLAQQLEDSLWALVEEIEPMHYQMDVLRHIPHMRGSNDRIRRVFEHHVLILCQCKTAMKFVRCHDPSGCEEECLPPEAVRWEDVRCVFHR